MDVSIAEAKKRLSELIRAVENGEQVVITRRGKPVAQITPPPAERRKVLWGTMRGRIGRKPGWDRPIGEDEFLNGNF
jgi:prevent-host-death family protein